MLQIAKSLATACLLLLPLQAAAQDGPPPMISVSGEGRVTAAPDIGTLGLGVRRQAATAAGAMQSASRAAEQILSSVEARGIDPRDVQTTRVALNPVWQHRNNQEPKITGYEAVNDLSIRVRDLDDMGALIDTLVQDGANSVQHIGFSIDDASALRSKARRAAVTDARARAAEMAEAAGVSLGDLAYLSESAGSQPRPPMPMRGAMMMDEALESAVPIAAGELEIVIRVEAAWTITQP